MGLKGTGKILQSGHARTQYIAIPADIVSDSQYPLKDGEQVLISLNPERKELIVSSGAKGTDVSLAQRKLVWEGGYEKFRDEIRSILTKNKEGMTWTSIKKELNFPQKVPNNQWVNRLKSDIGLINERKGKINIWRVKN